MKPEHQIHAPRMTDLSIADRWLVPLAIALIFVGFLSVWLPNQAAALAMLGLEIGEWVKFLPEVAAGQTTSRAWFYLPPLTLSLAVLVWSARWRNRWQTSLLRLLAVAAATLALPSIPDILEPSSIGELGERVRVLGVVLVALVAVGTSGLGRISWLKSSRIVPLMLVFLGLAGAIMPTYAYFSIRPIIASYLRQTPAVGYGLWLALCGHLLLIAAGWLLFQQAKREAS